MTHSHQLMHGLDLSGWRWARILWLATVCVTCFVSQHAYGQPAGKDMGYGYCSKHGNYKGASCPGCAGGSNSSQSGSYTYDPNRVTIFNFFSKMKEKKREARERQAYDANEEGIQYAQSGDFAKALAAYERAAQLDPTDPVIQGNLAKARARQRETDEQAQAEQQRKLEEERRKKQSAEAAQRMQQSIHNLAQSLTATQSVFPSTGGLDFDGGDTRPTSPTSSNALDFTTNLASSPNTDPMVVDLRTTPSNSITGSGVKPVLTMVDKAEPRPSTPLTVKARAPAPAAKPERSPESEPETGPSQKTEQEPAPEPATAPPPAAKGDSTAGHEAAEKTIGILDRAVGATLESLKISQSDESVILEKELTEIRTMLKIPPSGKKDDRTVRSVSFGHQKSDKSGDKQNAGQILVVRNEETGEVHIDVMQEQTGKPGKQTIIHIDRLGNIIAQEIK